MLRKQRRVLRSSDPFFSWLRKYPQVQMFKFTDTTSMTFIAFTKMEAEQFGGTRSKMSHRSDTAERRNKPHHFMHESWCSQLLSNAFEIWAHQLLYNRSVYRKETFTEVRFLGIQCFRHGHPDVQSYIRDTVAELIPAFLDEKANEVVFLRIASLGDDIVSLLPPSPSDTSASWRDQVVLEEFTLRWQPLDCSVYGNDVSGMSHHDIQHCVEETLREFVLRVLAIPMRTCKNTLSEQDQSFVLEIRLKNPITTIDSLHPSLQSGLREGIWCLGDISGMIDSPRSGGHTQGLVIRPLYEAKNVLGTISLVHRRQSPAARMQDETFADLEGNRS